MNLIEKQILLENHLLESKRILNESCRGLDKEQQTVVQGIYREFLPLIEASLTADQIKQMFGAIEKQSVASGANRTVVGAGVDVAKQANETINKIGQWLQNTTPVKNFDQKFENLKAKASEKFPDLADKLGAMGQWAKDNPGKTAAIIGVLTTIAGLAGGPVGGAIAGQILRGSVELLKGEKLSTAIGKGVKTAAYGFIAGKTFELIGDALSSGINAVADTLVPNAVRGNFSQIIDQVGGPLGDRFASFELKDLVGLPQDVNPIIGLAGEAADAWSAGNYELSRTLWQQVQDGVEVLYTPEYVAQLASDAATGQLIAQGASAVEGLADFMGAAAQGAVAAGVGGKDQQAQKKESVYVQSRPLSEGQIYLLFNRIAVQRLDEGPMDLLKKGAAAVGKGLSWAGKQATEKLTSAKLFASWKLEGSPTDSEALAKFLKGQEVPADIIKQVYADMKLPAPGSAPAAGDQQQPAANTQTVYAQVKADLEKLDKKGKQRILAYIQKQMGTA
jgi:hypothetical protein